MFVCIGTLPGVIRRILSAVYLTTRPWECKHKTSAAVLWKLPLIWRTSRIWFISNSFEFEFCEEQTIHCVREDFFFLSFLFLKNNGSTLMYLDISFCHVEIMCIRTYAFGTLWQSNRSNTFWTQSFFPVIDQLESLLWQRLEAYKTSW